MKFKLIILFLLALYYTTLSDSTDTFLIFHGDTTISDINPDFNNRGFYETQDYIKLFDDLKDLELLINSVNGNLLVRRHDYISSERSIPIKLVFTYNSGSSFRGHYGNYWQFAYNIRYIKNNYNDNIIVVYPDDRTSLYLYDKNKKTYSPHFFTFDSLRMEEDGKLKFKFRDKLITHENKTFTAEFLSPSHNYVSELSDEYGNKLTFAYDTGNQLKSVFYPANKAIHLLYENNLLMNIVLPGGLGATYLYDDVNNLTNVNLPNNDFYEFYYDTCGNLTNISNLSRSISISYDEDFKVSAILNQYDDLLYRFIYDTLSRTTTLILPDGSEKYYKYDTLERSIEYKHDQFIVKKSFNELNQVSEISYGNNLPYKFNYDKLGRLVSLVYPDNISKTFNYDENIIIEKTRSGGTNRYFLDDNSMIYKFESGNGDNIQLFRYNYGELSQINFNQHKISMVRDEYGRLRLLGLNDINRLEVEYNYDDELTAVIDEVMNSKTSFKHTMTGDLSSITYNDGSFKGIYFRSFPREIIFSDRNSEINSYKFDDINRLIKITNPLKHEYNIEYDSFNEFKLLHNDLRYGFSYGANGLIDNIIMHDNKTLNFEYNLSGNLTELHYNGLTHLFDYNSLNKVIKYTNPSSGITEYSYSPGLNVSSVNDAIGRSIIMYFDNYERPTRKAVGSQNIYYSYPEPGKTIVKFNDMLTNTFVEDYFHGLTSNEVIGGDSYHYKYDNAGNLTEILKNFKYASTFKYDNLYNIVESNIFGEGKYSFLYDKSRRLIRKIRTDNIFVSYNYDLMGRLIEIIDENSKSKFYEWDNFNNLTKFIDKSGYVYNFNFTSSNAEIQMPDNSIYRYSYGGNFNFQRLLSVTNTDNSHTGFFYDYNGNLIRINDGNNNQIVSSYNSDNTLQSFTNPLGQKYEFTYDFLKRLINIKNPDNNNKTFNYTPTGNILSVTDYSGLTYNLSYNNSNNLLSVNSDNFRLQYHYDENGRLVSFNDYLSNFIKFEYGGAFINKIIGFNNDTVKLYHNDYGKLIMKINELNETFTYHYLSTGFLNRISSNYGVDLSIAYDANDKITYLAIDTLSLLRLTYNNIGNIKSILSPKHNNEYTYQPGGLISQKNEIAGNTINYGYDYHGRIIFKRYPDEKRETFAYDSRGQLVEHTFTDGLLYNLEYNHYGLLSKVKWSRIDSLIINYNKDGQISEIIEPNFTGRSFGWARGGRLQYFNLFESGNTEIRTTLNTDNVYRVKFGFSDFDSANYIFDKSLRFIDVYGSNNDKINYDKRGARLNGIFTKNTKHNTLKYNFFTSNGRLTVADNDLLRYNVKYPNKSLLPIEITNGSESSSFIFNNLLNVISYKHDSSEIKYAYYNDLLTMIIDESKNYSQIFNYNFNKQMISIDFNQEYQIILNYNNSNNISNLFDNFNNKISLNYDTKGNTRKILKNDGNELEYLFDTYTNPIIIKNETIDNTGITYDKRNLPVSVAMPDLTYANYQYDELFNTTVINSDNDNHTQIKMSNSNDNAFRLLQLDYTNNAAISLVNSGTKSLILNDVVYSEIISANPDIARLRLINGDLINIYSDTNKVRFELSTGIGFEYNQIGLDKEHIQLHSPQFSSPIDFDIKYDGNQISIIKMNKSIIRNDSLTYTGEINTYFNSFTGSHIRVKSYPDGRIAHIVKDSLTELFEYDFNNRLVRSGDFLLSYDERGNITGKESADSSYYYTYSYDNLLTMISSTHGDTIYLKYTPRRVLSEILTRKDTILLVPADATSQPEFPFYKAVLNSDASIKQVIDSYAHKSKKVMYILNQDDLSIIYPIMLRNNTMLGYFDQEGKFNLTINDFNPLGGLQNKQVHSLSFVNNMIYFNNLNLLYDGKRFFDPEILTYLQENFINHDNPLSIHSHKFTRKEKEERLFGINEEYILPLNNPFHNRFTQLRDEADPYGLYDEELDRMYNGFKNFNLTKADYYSTPQLNEDIIHATSPDDILTGNFENNFSISAKLPQELLDTALKHNSKSFFAVNIPHTPSGNEIEMISGYVKLADFPKHSVVRRILDFIQSLKDPREVIVINNIYYEGHINPDLEFIETILRNNNTFDRTLQDNLHNYEFNYMSPIESVRAYLDFVDEDSNLIDIMQVNRFVAAMNFESYNPVRYKAHEALLAEKLAELNVSNFINESLNINPKDIFPGRTLYKTSLIPLPYSFDYYNNLHGIHFERKTINMNPR